MSEPRKGRPSPGEELGGVGSFTDSEPELPAEPSALEESAWEPVPGDPRDTGVGETDLVVALLGAALRQGVWEPSESVRVFSLMGAATLDFRDAELLEGVTEISVLTIMGSVRIIVPPDLDVDMNGLGLMGDFPHFSRRRSESPSTPLLRIRGLSLMGGVQVKVA